MRRFATEGRIYGRYGRIFPVWSASDQAGLLDKCIRKDTTAVIQIRETTVFRRWLDNLRDENAWRRITVRLRRLAEGNPGDTKSIGGGLSELRIDYGPGYRVYFARRGNELILLLAGGDKRTQWKDIEIARALARRMME
jgi:putative addiction module killer protein